MGLYPRIQPLDLHDFQTGFFTHFARERVDERFKLLDPTAR